MQQGPETATSCRQREEFLTLSFDQGSDMGERCGGGGCCTMSG